jgi:hypothetical protein
MNTPYLLTLFKLLLVPQTSMIKYRQVNYGGGSGKVIL